jgi:threonine synthase
MDVGAPSNFERMLWLCNDSYDQMCSEIKGFSCADDHILDAIREIYNTTGYISDPHSAVGYLATKKYSDPGFWLSTAHAAKFCEVIEQAIGLVPELPEGLAAAIEKKKVYTDISADESDLKKYLENL